MSDFTINFLGEKIINILILAIADTILNLDLSTIDKGLWKVYVHVFNR